MDFVYNPNNNSGTNPAGYVSENNGSSMYGSPDTVNRNFFNQNGGFNFKDSTAFAYSQLAQREANAFNVDVMNYMNEYNSPLEQMKRRIAAGLNPYSDINSAAAAQAPGAGSAKGISSYVQEQSMKINAANSVINGVASILDGALSAKRDLLELEVLPDILNEKKRQAITRTDIDKNTYEAGSLKNASAALQILRLAYDYGIELKPQTLYGDGEGNIGLLGAILGPYSEVLGVADNSPYSQLQQALLELRQEQKQTQKSQQSRNYAGASESRTRVDQKNITGIPVIDKILNGMLD